MTLQSFERAPTQPKPSSPAWVALFSLFSLMMLSGQASAAPATFEMFAASGNTGAVGPTTASQTHTYRYNTNNPTGNAVQTVYPQPTVTYSLENQQYTDGLVFGNAVNPQNSFVALATQGEPINTDFASSRNNAANPQGIDVNSNHGLRMTLVTGRLTGQVQRNTTAVNGGLGYYYGDLVMTWSRPVLNPVINMSGLGGTGGSPVFGFSAGAELFNPPAGTTISRLAGTNLAVTGLTIRNNATTIGATRTTGGASGSVQVLNTNPITTLRFRLYVRSDSTSTSTNWGDNTDGVGEAFLFSSSSVDAVVGDLFVSKTNNVTTVTSGSSTTYTVRVTNNGPSTIDGAILNDVVGTGLSATSAVCSAAASNRCTTAPNLANLTGAGVTLPSLASGQFYEISVTANVSGSGSVINSARVSLPASNTASNTGASCVTSGGITRSFNTTTGACTSTDTDTIFVPSPPLQCASNIYTLQGDTADIFQNIRTMQPDGTLGTVITQVPANTGGTTPQRNVGLAINPDGTKVFVTTPQNTLRVYDVVTNTWVANVTVPSGNGGIRATVSSSGVGYLSSENQLWTFQTSAPYTVSGPVTITSINGGPAPTNSSGDFFSDSSGNLFLLANPTSSGTTLNLYRIAANGNSLYLGTVASTDGQYGGYAAIPSGIYASSTTGTVLRADLSTFVATQTAAASSARASSDLASCFYPSLNPVIQALKTSTKVAGSAGTEVRPGDTLEYRIVIRNIGTVPAADVRFQDSIPAGTTYVAGSTTYNYTIASGKPQVALADIGGVMPFVTARTIESPAPTPSNGILLVDQTSAGTMALNEAERDREVVITFRVTVNASATSVSNQGTVSYISDPEPPTTTPVDTDDPNTPVPNDATTTTILRDTDLSITKTGTQSANTGSIVSYVIRVTNNGAIAVNGAVINDTLPAGLSNAYWNCVVPIDGVFATTANIGTRTDEVCISPATSATTLRQTSSVIAQTVNLPAGQSVEIRVIGRANGGMLSNTASVTVPTGITDPNLTNNTTAAVNTSVLSALDVASCNAVKMIDANGLLNSPVAWPVQQGTITPTVSFNRSGTFDINRTHTAPSVSTGTAPNPMVIGLGTDRTTKTSSTTWSWTATFSQPVPLNQIYMYLTDLNSFDPTVTLSLSGGTATLANLSGYSSNHGGAAQELVFDQSNGQIIRAFNRNTGSAAADSNPRGSMVLLSSSSNTVTSITLSSTNTITGDNIGIDFGARVGCDYGDAPDTFGNPRAGVLSSYLQMGASIPDTEAAPAIPRNFTGDDVTGRDDEDIINVTPQLNIVDTSFSLNGLSVLNTTEGAATLRGWIDVNGNGVVDAGEQATVAVPSNASAQTVSLNWPSLPTLTVGSKLLRFTLLDDTNSFFGEIEDHQLEVLGLAQITGRVFTDNSGTTGIAANAYNGIQNTGELGLAGSTVELNNCAGTVIATTQTDGAGDYSFGVLLNQLSTPNFCITQTNLAGYTSVSGTAGYARATDTITIANTSALSYTGHNFGDARLNLVLTSDGQQTTTPSGTVSYPHILRSESVLSVGTLNTISTESPTLGWTTVLYRDTNCNGAVDTGESALTSAIGQLLPNQEICVVQRVNAPANATNGAQHVATLSASYTATVQDSGVLSGSSNTRTDTTLVGTAGLDMRKQVRVVASCPSTGADVAAFTERNTAQNGDFLEYQIIYSNRSTRNLSQLTVRDVAPSSTTFQSAICQSTPSGSGCIPPASAGVNGDLAWSLTNIAPAATGSVRFCVRVPPLAEPPIRQ